jgi:hypothetical protein
VEGWGRRSLLQAHGPKARVVYTRSLLQAHGPKARVVYTRSLLQAHGPKARVVYTHAVSRMVPPFPSPPPAAPAPPPRSQVSQWSHLSQHPINEPIAPAALTTPPRMDTNCTTLSLILANTVRSFYYARRTVRSPRRLDHSSHALTPLNILTPRLFSLVWRRRSN